MARKPSIIPRIANAVRNASERAAERKRAERMVPRYDDERKFITSVRKDGSIRPGTKAAHRNPNPKLNDDTTEVKPYTR